jgi:hypothetical protein
MLKELTEQFSNPLCQYRGAPFWSWNDKMEGPEIRRQIRDFHAAGIGGFFMHSRGGLETAFLSEEWFRACDAAIDEARKLGMLAWAYDEDRWPSGQAGGITTGRFPETAARVVEAVRQDAWPTLQAGVISCFRQGRKGWSYLKKAPAAGRDYTSSLGQFLVFYEHASKSHSWHNGRPPFDLLDKDAVRLFIETAYKPYVDRYPADLGKTLPGVFTDEPNYFGFGQRQSETGGVVMPWTPTLLKRFHKRRGYDLAPYLPALLGEKLDADKPGDEIRHDYWLTLTEMFVANYSAQIGKYCKKHKIAFTGHYLWEETLMGQAHVGGCTMPHYVHEQVPGVDILCRRTSELLTVKQAASVAHQWGRSRLISELYGASGWDLSLQDQKWIGDWQYALGVNYRCQHLCLYSLRGERKRDFPPSHMPHQPWWAQYKTVEDYFARLSLALSLGEPVREVAVIHPIRSAWAALHLPYDAKKMEQWPVQVKLQEMLDTLLYNQIDLDFVDEMLLEQYGGVKKGRLFVNKADYKIVVVPEMTHIAPATAEALLEAARQGVTILSCGTRPVKVYQSDASVRVRQDLEEQFNALLQGHRVSLKALPETLRKQMAEPVTIKPATRLLYQLREEGRQRTLFLTNQQEKSAEFTVEITGGQDLQRWCTESGNPSAWPFELTSRGVRFKVWLAQAGSAVFTYLADKPAQALSGEVLAPAAATAISLPDQVPYRIDRSNVLYVDRAAVVVEGTNIALEGFLPQVCREVRAIFDLQDIRYHGNQPWAWRRRPADKQVVITYTFDVEEVPAGMVSLGIEQPQRKKISLNGQPVVSPASGYYLDPSIAVVALPSLRAGRNTIEVREDLDEDFEAEAVYLLGAFGVKDRKVVRLPETIHPGDWTGQGLPYFAGRLSVSVPVTVQEAGTYDIELVTQGVVTIGVGVEGQPLEYRAFAPWRFPVPLRAGANTLTIEMANSLRNLMGPHHCREERPMWVGPGELAPEVPVDRYVHIPSGILELKMVKVS